MSNVKELDNKATETLKEYNEDLFWCIQFSMMSFKCSKECHPDTYRWKISPSDIRKKGYKIDYKSFSVVKNIKNLIDGENLKEEKRTKNCVHGMLHERTDVKNSLKNTCEGVQH